MWLAPKAGRVGRSASGPEPPFDVIAANGNLSPRCTLNSLGVCTRSVRNAAQARHLVLPRSGKSSHFCRPQRGKNLEFAGRGTKGKFAAVFKGRYFESAFRPFVVDLEKVGKASIMKSTSYGYL